MHRHQGIGAVGLLAVLSCVTAPQTKIEVPQLKSAGSAPSPQLVAAADAFYAASTVEALESSLREVEKLGPGTAIHHEVAAVMAAYRADYAGRFEHLKAALLDPSNDAPQLHLEWLWRTGRSIDEELQLMGLLEALRSNHPRADVRALAHARFARLAHRRGDAAAVEKALAAIPGRLDFAFVGAFDNDQGQGFDTAYQPETDLDFEHRYDGVLREVKWRLEPARPLDRIGYDLGALFTPFKWAIAYGAASARIQTAGTYQLRVTSSAPFKLWVNGTQVFEQRHVESSRFDQFVIPLKLSAGVQRILVKSAQDQGIWYFGARMTNGIGDPAVGLKVERPTVAPSARPPERPEGRPFIMGDGEGVAGRARRLLHSLHWVRALGLKTAALQGADQAYTQLPGALAFAEYLYRVSWEFGERGQASDVLEKLDASVGTALPRFRLQLSRFQRGDRLTKKAREKLEAVEKEHPGLAATDYEFAELFATEGWREDRCQALDRALVHRPGWMGPIISGAVCRAKLGFEVDAIERLQPIVAAFPQHATVLRKLYDLHMTRHDFAAAKEVAERYAAANPHQPNGFWLLAETNRRLGDRVGADAALARAKRLDPDASRSFKASAQMAYLAGDKKEAIADWNQALERDPEDDRLANRLSYLAPEAKEEWEKEAPEEDALMAAVDQRKSIKPLQGADVLDLLDHEVTRFNGDGSTYNITSRVMHSVNKSGRDTMTKVALPQGRVRVRQAFAVDPQGARVQASSIRGRTVRFRGLKVGSTVVLQYRHDTRPVGYLSKHVARSWWFQAPSHQTVRSEWVVWSNPATVFHEWLQGDIKRSEEMRGSLKRVAWRAENLPPLLVEPSMPTVNEAAASMLLSTVPSWDVFMEWEKALLQDVFRETEEVKAIATKLFDGAKDPQEKVRRIQAYLMEEIRYQMDYETHIAGVKPHAASVVVKRAYGDCKDKAVLFITLAKLAQVQVHFAILRTRTKGPVRKEVPMQQFNHAIVYVPAQPGIAEGRFYDPTADALDVDVVRADDVGTIALVLDPKTMEHTWRKIPYQSPRMNSQAVSTVLSLSSSGRATGKLTLEATGSLGSMVRRLARNKERFAKGLQLYLSQKFPGASTEPLADRQVDDLRAPAKVNLTLDAPNYGRVEGSTLRVELPKIWNPEGVFRLAKRMYPLVLGTPFHLTWTSEFELPPGARVKRLPKALKVSSRCFEFKRTVKRTGKRVEVVQEFETRCERIPTAEYLVHRERAEDIIRASREAVVLHVPSLEKTKSAGL